MKSSYSSLGQPPNQVEDEAPLLENGRIASFDENEAPSSSSRRRQNEEEFHSKNHSSFSNSSSSNGRSRRSRLAVILIVTFVIIASIVMVVVRNHGFGFGSSSNINQLSFAEGGSAQQAQGQQKKTSTSISGTTSGKAGNVMTTALTSPPPTAAPTYLNTMLYVIQRVDGITLEQSLDSKFESAFVTGVVTGSTVHLTMVKYVESKSALYGAGVDCEYFVEAKNTNVEELTAVVRSGTVTDNLITTLVASGYGEASCSAQAIIVDVSPTSAPTFVPTYSKAYAEVKQHIDGVTVEQAESSEFIDTVTESVAGAMQIPEEDILYEGAVVQGDSGVEITYMVALRNTDVNSLIKPLTATHTSSALTSALHLSGFDEASAQPVTEVTDVSPTSSPTVLQTSAMVMIEAKQAIYGVTYTQANQASFTGIFRQGIALGLGIKEEDVSVVSVEGTPLSATIVYITFDVYQQSAQYAAVSAKLQSEDTREIVGKKLIAATGYSITIPMAAETTDFSPTPVPTSRPTHELTVLQIVQRVDGITIDEVNESPKLFDESFITGVVAASKISADYITISSVEQAKFSKNAIDVKYVIQAEGTDSVFLTDALTTEDAATIMTESLVAGSFKYTEVAQAAIVTDLSPTPVPTGRPTQLTTIMQVIQPITGVNSDQASSATFTKTVLQAVTTQCSIPSSDVVIVSEDDSEDGQGVDLAYSVQVSGTNSATLGGCLGSKDLAAHLSTDLKTAGYSSASVEIGIVTDVTPTGAPSFMPTQMLTLIQAVQEVAHVSVGQANEASFTNAFQRSLAASCDVPIGNVNIIMISTDDTPGAVSVTYQIQAPETNYATIAGDLTSPSTVSSLSVALNKAGYRDALVDSAPTVVDISPTSAPTVASTLKVVMLTATQDVADVSVSQAASSEFQTAFLTGVVDVLQEADEQLPTSGVKITTINADPSGSGVSVTYSVTASKTSPKILEDVIISPAMTNRINTDLHAAGFTDADAHGHAIIVDSSPTGAPSMAPTQAILLVWVNQRVDGLTKAQAATELFTIVLRNCVSRALSIDDLNVVFEAAETASDNRNSVYVDFTVVAPNTNMHLLSGQLASEDLKDSCTKDMQSNGYAAAQMLENPTISDLSPTASPTVNPHYPTMAPTINPKCGERVVVLFTQRIDNVNIMQASNEAFISEFMEAVSTGSSIPADDITYLGQNPAKYGVAVDMVFQIETDTTTFANGDALIERMQGPSVTEAEQGALNDFGFKGASCAAEVISQDLCK